MWSPSVAKILLAQAAEQGGDDNANSNMNVKL
jgi:hypothetical protein